MTRPAVVAVTLVVALLAAAAWAAPSSTHVSRELRLTGSFHGTAFAAEHGWIFVKVTFSECGRQRMAIQIAVAQAHYNLTCEHEPYSVIGVPAAALRASSNPDDRVADLRLLQLQLTNVEAGRGCIHNRIEDRDYDGVSIVAHTPNSALTGGANAAPAEPAWLDVTLVGLPAPVPSPLPVTLMPSSSAPRTEADLAQHFPPHRWKKLAHDNDEQAGTHPYPNDGGVRRFSQRLNLKDGEL